MNGDADLEGNLSSPALWSRAARAMRILMRPGKARSLIGFAVGVVLLLLALWTIAGESRTLSDAWAAAARASGPIVLAILLLPILNWVATTGAFWILTTRYGRVTFREMAALIGAAWLLNMLPMRPGLFGRIAYHKAVHSIAIRDSIRVQICTLSATGVGLALLVPCVLLSGGWPDWGVILVAVSPAVVLALSSALARRIAPSHLTWRFLAACSFRSIDMLIWTIRYFLVFLLIDRPIHMDAAAAVTAAGQATSISPVQLGLREWIVGLTIQIRPEWLGGEHGASVINGAAPGLVADLINRASELAVFVPLGLIAAGWLWRRRAKGRTSDNTDTSGNNSQSD